MKLSTYPKIILFIFTFFFYVFAKADDTTIGYFDGSLVFTQDNDISMDYESLSISSSKINILYSFYNHSDHPIKKTVAFPFPAKPYNGSIPTQAKPCFDKYVEKKPSKECPFLDFVAKINGEAVKKYEVHYIATDQNGHDITKLLTENNIPLSGYYVSGRRDYDGTYTGGEIDKNSTLKEKLKKLNISPNWSTQILLSWEEIFPPKSKVTVEESYTPSIGISLAIGCDEKKYCIHKNDVSFFQQKCHASDHPIGYIKTIQYVLTTGSHWKDKTIKNFHLEIVPSKSEIVGFCYPDPMRREGNKYVGDFLNFIPEKDLTISFLQI